MWVGSQGPLGGVMELAKAEPHWMGHIQVADLKGTMEKLRRLGGKVFHDPAAIPQAGSFAVVTDPQGLGSEWPHEHPRWRPHCAAERSARRRFRATRNAQDLRHLID
jgi:hypothetical protein